jgi:hypothetical protein
MSITAFSVTRTWSLLKIRHIHRGPAVANGAIAQLRNQIGREQVIERENHDPLCKDTWIPLLQTDLGLACSLLGMNYVAANRITVCTDDDREVRQMEFTGAAVKIVLDDHARALVDALRFTHLLWGERKARMLGMVHRKRPVGRRLRQTD